MTKESLLNVRIGADDKRRIADAARRKGLSITTFVVEAAMTSVEEMENTPSAHEPRSGGPRPTFFVAMCETAKAGGGIGYDTAGVELARHIESLAPDDIQAAEWSERVAELGRVLLSAGTARETISWFQMNLPRCLELVPQRRHARFVDGLRAYAEEHGL